MALVSFTVRNTISDEGSALRRTKVTQDSSTPNGTGDAVYDSGLRSDGYLPPAQDAFATSLFSAEVFERDTILLGWELGFTLVETVSTGIQPVEMVIRASAYGEPVTVSDGDFVTKVTALDFSTSYEDKNTNYVLEGNWVYYSVFVKYEDSTASGYYERVATLSVQIPRDFDSFNALWNRIPAYYRELDAQQVTLSNGLTPLYSFIELFAWELDKFRTTIYDTMRINDPNVIHSSAINALAKQNGIDFTKEALGTSKLRAVLDNVGYLRRTKGTMESIEAYISALSGCGVTTELNAGVFNFNVHPMRVNLVTDPFFNQAVTGPTPTDTGTSQRVYARYESSGRTHGWGVFAIFSGDPTTDMTVSTAGDKLTVTLPALSGTVSVLIYSRGEFNYNNDLTYYFSGVASHSYKPRFVAPANLLGLETLLSPPTSVTYFDDWNNSVTTFPTFKDFLTNDTRKIVASIPKTTSVASSSVVPVFKFDITLSAGSSTTLTLEKPLVEYRKSNGEFFSGNESSGGFIQDPTGSTGEGLYDYHWGPNADSSKDTDFSYYTLDYHRSQSVVDYIIENYIVPVTIVKNTDYIINWDVLE
jgi:hypothetical protein